MTADESGACGAQDARGLGALTHQSKRTTGGAERMAREVLGETGAIMDYNGYTVSIDIRGASVVRDTRFGPISEGVVLAAQHLLALKVGHGGAEAFGMVHPDSWEGARVAVLVEPAVVDLGDDDG